MAEVIKTVAEVTDDPVKAAGLAAAGAPVVLVGPDAESLGRWLLAVAGAAGGPPGTCKSGGVGSLAAGGGSPLAAGEASAATALCLPAVMVGELGRPEVAAAAAEMAAELWPRAKEELPGLRRGRRIRRGPT